MKSSLLSLVRSTVVLVTIVSLTSVHAAVWSGTASVESGLGTLWDTGANWDTATVPGVGVDADCQMTGADYTINYNSAYYTGEGGQPTSFGRLYVDNDEDHTTTLNITAADFVSTVNSINLTIGSSGAVVVGTGGDATIKAMTGGWNKNEIYGAFTVDGGSATLRADGYNRVYSGGSVTVNSGQLVMDGYGDRGGAILSGGTMTIKDGQVDILDGMKIGISSTTGTVDMSGGTVNISGVLNVGRDNHSGGKGILNLSGGQWTQVGGGQVTFGAVRGSGNQLNVTGSGVFNTSGNTLIGDASSGDVLNVNGGSYIATNGSGDAAITVKNGTLRLQSGILTMDRLNASASTSSAVAFTGGTMTINDSSTVDNGSTLQVGDGTKEALLVLNGGTHSFADGLVISSNAALQGTGTITTPVGTTSTSIADGATLIPGNSIGTLNVTHDLGITDGASYDYEISSASVHDLVAVGGELTLPGTALTLNLSLIEPKKVLSPTNVELFTYNSLVGNVDSIDWTINLIGDYWLGTPTVFDNEAGTIFLGGVSFIPEPASIALLGLGVLALLRRNRKQ